MDGSRIKWNIYKPNKTNNKKKYKSPVNNKLKSYDVTTYDNSTNKNKSVSSFFSSFAHSIDGAVMRIILLKTYDDSKYIINHLHDSISFHPNHYKDVMKSVEYAYSREVMRDVVDRYLLDNLRSNLINEKHIIFDQLVDKFKTDYTTIDLETQKINVEKMFPFE